MTSRSASPHISPRFHSRFSHARRRVRAVLLTVGIAVSATAAVSAWAHGPGPSGHSGMGMMSANPERMNRMVDRMLDGLNASDTQRAQIKQIVHTAAADMRPQRETSRALREQAMRIFTAPTVDAHAAEQLRQQMVAQHDQRSRRMTTAMVEISRVLTPEQRVKVAERMQQRAERMQERMQRNGPP